MELNLSNKKNEIRERNNNIENQIIELFDGNVGVYYKNGSHMKLYMCDTGMDIKDNMDILEKIINNVNLCSNEIYTRLLIKLDRKLTLDLQSINGYPRDTYKDEIEKSNDDIYNNGIYKYLLCFEKNKLIQIIDYNLDITINL